ncbi:unnamed protein product [Chironomus riparius]|uniref:Ionotropic receptor n=1 Tax=Chironomus riparius TaxID=315576 RepID=A0A9N9RMV8_9DIPT|nr:unnamed protein product [Chironomus riparius]
MKFTLFWIFISFFRTRNCNLELEENSEINFRLKVFSDAIEKLYFDNSIDFNLIIYRNADKTIIDQIEIFKSGNYAYELKLLSLNPSSSCFDIDNSAIIFLEDLEALNEFNFYVRLTNDFPKELKFLVWFDDATISLIHVEHLYDDYGDITQYEYIIFYIEDNLNIFTFDWFEEEFCGSPKLLALDTIHNESMHWNQNITKYKKFRNFNNCVLYSNLGEVFEVNSHLDRSRNKMNGLLVDLFNAMGQKGNFDANYLPIPAFHLQAKSRCLNEKLQTNFVRTFYHVFHKVKANGAGYHVTSTFRQTQFIFLLTASDPITITEKLFLPFDIHTWIMLIITFGIAFLVIFITNQMPKKFQKLIYGTGIKTPVLNIFYIFFGIGQMKIPDKTFPRFLLTSFILFCLIFRTCYQTKLAFFIPDEQLAILKQDCKCEPKILKQPLFTIQVGIGLLPNHFLYDLTEDVVQRFISAGIIQYFYEYYGWLLFHTRINNEDTGPKVLTYDDLAFGFHIFIMNLLLLMQLNLITCSILEEEILEENSSIKSVHLRAFLEAIDELFVENSIIFDMVVYADANQSIINEIGMESSGNFSYELKLVNSSLFNPCFSLNNSAVIIVSDEKALNDFNYHARITNDFPKPLRFLVWMNDMPLSVLLKSEGFLYDDFGDITYLKGVLVDFFDSIAQKGNFSTSYTSIFGIHKQFVPYCINEKVHKGFSITKYQVFQKFKSIVTHYHVTSTFQQTKFIFLLTSSEPVTITEKLFLPFDFQTWIMLIITFGIALLVILFANCLPKTFKNLIYGKGVETPGLNLCYIFFGIGQMKVPDKSFPRFLLMSFILFCLIFRTCYQSKLFEFMTTDMRQSSPVTIDDLYENGFVIYTIGFPHVIDHLNSMIDKKRRPIIKALNSFAEFQILYVSQRQNYSAKLAFFVPDDQLSTLRQLYIENYLEFDVIIYGNASKLTIDQLGLKNFEMFPYDLKIISNKVVTECLDISKSAIIFVQNITDLNDFNFIAKLSNYFPKTLKFLIWMDDMEVLSYGNIEHFLHDNPAHVSLYEYILQDLNGTLELITFEWFGDGFCNSPKPLSIGQFNSTSMKWNKNIQSYKKFRNFHKCLLVSDLTEQIAVNRYNDKISGKSKGFMIDLFTAIAQKGNFSTVFFYRYRPAPFNGIECMKQKRMKEKDKRRNKINFDVCLRIKANGHTDHITSTFHQTSYIFLITPDDPITITEKLFLPFDEFTWIMLIITFGIAFLVIFITNQMPIKFQKLIYGTGIKTPVLNIFYIFFGIGQMKIPDKTFPRFLLTSFILFCLIFRTCYQSKLFEFMTSDMRKASPLTIDDLYEKNFLIHTMDYPNVLNVLTNMIDHRKRPQIITTNNMLQLYSHYISQRKNHSSRLAFFIPNDELVFIKKKCKCSPKILNQALFSIQIGIGLIPNHFLYDLTEDVMQQLIPMGIVQYMLEFHTWMKFRTDIILPSSQPAVLSIDNVAFGFYICMVTCGFSIVAFVMEILIFKLKMRMNKFIGNFVFKRIQDIYDMSGRERCQRQSLES